MSLNLHQSWSLTLPHYCLQPPWPNFHYPLMTTLTPFHCITKIYFCILSQTQKSPYLNKGWVPCYEVELFFFFHSLILILYKRYCWQDYYLKDVESVAKMIKHSNCVINLIGRQYETRYMYIYRAWKGAFLLFGMSRFSCQQVNFSFSFS